MFGKSKPMLKRPEWKPAYDAVIIGGGAHGLAAAYFLAKAHGMKNCAVVLPGSGATSGIGAGGVHSYGPTPESIRLHIEGMRFWPELTRKLGVNLMFSGSGVLHLAHSEDEMSGLTRYAAIAALGGKKVEFLTPQECWHKIPALDISKSRRHPVAGGLFDPQGGAVHPDAVMWGLAKEATRLGVDIHRETAVTGIGVEGGRITRVETSKGAISTPMVLNAVGTGAAQICRMIGLEIPVHPCRVEGVVTQSLKPLLNPVLLSGAYPCYINQKLNGEILVWGRAVSCADGALPASPVSLHSHIWAMTQLLPCLKGVQVTQIRTGQVDATPDGLPILDGNGPVQGFFMGCGWGEDGFNAEPIAGKYMAAFMNSGQKPGGLLPFGPDRFGRMGFLKEQRQEM